MKNTASTAAMTALIASLLASCGGGGGSSPTPSPPPPSPPAGDTAAPVTTLTSTPPALTNLTTGAFVFSANETSTFESRLDSAAFAAATSPQNVSNLGEGSHTFEVRARDTAGNTDATPASFTWVIDTTPPNTTITAAPSTIAVVKAATFTVTSTETGGTFEASVDGGAFAAVPIPYTAGGLADGAHSIQFRARDGAGNVDATPESASWTLDATPAQVRLLFPSRNFYTDAATVSVRGTAQDAHGVTAVSVNGVAAQTTDAFAHWSAVIPVPVGTTPVSISSTDGPGNTADVALSSMTNRGPYVHIARSVAFDAVRNRVLINDWGNGNIDAISRSDGIGIALSPGPAQGTTPGSGFQEMVVDAANDRLLALDGANDELVAINLATGARTVLSPSGGSSSPTTFQTGVGIALDAANQRAYVPVGGTHSLVRINLANGVRSVVSSDIIGTGTPISNPYGIVFDNVTNPGAPRLLVVDAASIVTIDPVTGNRTPLPVGTGPAISNPLSMVLDPIGQRVIVNEASGATLVAVALATGNRTTLADGAVGSGPYMPFFGVGLAFDPVNRILFAPQDGGFGEVNAVTLARRLVAQQVGTGDRINTPAALAIEQTSGTPTSLVYVQDGSGSFYRLDLATGNRQMISGAGPSLQGAVDMVLDRRPAANGRAALVLIRGSTPALVSVDLVTGVRTLITNIVTSAMNNAPQRMVLDVANNRVLFGNDELQSADVDQLYAINLSNNVITAISDASKTGPIFARPGFMVLEPATNPTRVIIDDTFAGQFLAINLATGNRSTFDTSSGGSGATYQRSGPMIVDTANARLLVNHTYYPSNIFTIPLTGGTREIVTGANPTGLSIRGTGPPLFYVTAMDVDFAAQVAYEASANSAAIVAVDLVSGDRVVLAH